VALVEGLGNGERVVEAQPLGEGERDATPPLAVGAPLPLAHAVLQADGDGVAAAVPLALAHGEAEKQGAPLREALPLPLPLLATLPVGERLGHPLAEAHTVALNDGRGDWVPHAHGVGVWDTLPEADADRQREGEALPDGLRDGGALAVGHTEAAVVAVPQPLPEGNTVPVVHPEPLPLALAAVLPEGVRLGLPQAEAQWEPLGEGVGVGAADEQGVGVPDAVPQPLTDAQGEGSGERLRSELPDAQGEGAGLPVGEADVERQREGEGVLELVDVPPAPPARGSLPLAQPEPKMEGVCEPESEAEPL